jgi:hypothetical protein
MDVRFTAVNTDGYGEVGIAMNASGGAVETDDSSIAGVNPEADGRQITAQLLKRPPQIGINTIDGLVKTNGSTSTFTFGNYGGIIGWYLA